MRRGRDDSSGGLGALAVLAGWPERRDSADRARHSQTALCVETPWSSGLTCKGIDLVPGPLILLIRRGLVYRVEVWHALSVTDRVRRSLLDS